MTKPIEIKFHNTLTRKKQVFEPIDPKKVRVYACGPTVYDRIHTGNARPLVVFDVLVRFLRQIYGKNNVVYVRNITDVDDKINANAAAKGISIEELTQGTIARFHRDCEILGLMPPDVEPRATEHIAAMVTMIETLLAKGHAYEAEGHVLFDVSSAKNYGCLSNYSLDEIVAGARVEIAPFKKDSADFVLWKPSSPEIPGWDSPWGRGRPGWHIECSAMAKEYLGERFDIHAGGIDLIFPHHENEIAQSCCAHGNDEMARFWMHNGYVTVGGQKMSKSLDNASGLGDGADAHIGGNIRYALLTTHYRSHLDYSTKVFMEQGNALDRLYEAAENAAPAEAPPVALLEALADDLNTPEALAVLHGLARKANKGDTTAASGLATALHFLGFRGHSARAAILHDREGGESLVPISKKIYGGLTEQDIKKSIIARNLAREEGNYAKADDIRNTLIGRGILLEDTADGTIARRIKKP